MLYLERGHFHEYETVAKKLRDMRRTISLVNVKSWTDGISWRMHVESLCIFALLEHLLAGKEIPRPGCEESISLSFMPDVLSPQCLATPDLLVLKSMREDVFVAYGNAYAKIRRWFPLLEKEFETVTSL